jgi:hypothetical protein
MSIKKVTQHPTQNEALIFERSQTGTRRLSSAETRCRRNESRRNFAAELSRTDDLEGVPEVSEVDVVGILRECQRGIIRLIWECIRSVPAR